MRLVTSCLVAALVSAAPAFAGTIIYATAASQSRIDGFCVGNDGTLAPTPKVQIGTGGQLPRRLVAGPNGVLYVAEADRVEAFRIGQRGGLEPFGSTNVVTGPNMNPLDVALSPDARLLYVPQNGQARIVAYPLDADGRLQSDFTSCIQGPGGAGYQRLLVRDGLLYVTAEVLGGRVSVFPLGADGSLSAPPDQCRLGNVNVDRSPVTCPLSERRHLLLPAALIIDGDVMYVESRARRQIVTFRLTNGLFDPPHRNKTGEFVSVCLKDDAGKDLTGNFKYQKALNKSAVLNQYQDIVLDGTTILGSQFTHGRVDAYHVRPDGRISKHPRRRTKEDVRGSPVGLASTPSAVYVAAGEFDRVQAFRVRRSDGMLAEETPFSQTNEQTGSFPNALAVATIPLSCF